MNLKAALIYWKLAIFRVSGKAMIAIALAIAQGLNGANWSDFTPTQQFVSIVLAVGSGWSIIDAFLDQTLSNIQHSGLGIPRATMPGADVTQHTHVTQDTTTTPLAKAPPAP